VEGIINETKIRSIMSYSH